MVLEAIRKPLVLKRVSKPIPSPHEVLIKVLACGVCRTDLHLIDGELPNLKLPIIPGHQIVGIVEALGSEVSLYKLGERVGVPWLAGTCHHCEYCLSSKENLCDNALFTGYLRDGGFAEYCTAHEAYCLTLPERYTDVESAPLLCAGLIGYRALKHTGKGKKIGFYGFGSSAHLLIQLAPLLGKEIYVFTKAGDTKRQAFAKSLGAFWAGCSDEHPPELLDAAIIFAPVGALYPTALKAVKKGGKVISAGIHMSDIPSFPYNLLWGERQMVSIANLTREDGKAYMNLASKQLIQANITLYPLEKTNDALDALRKGSIEGSAVITL